MNTEQSQRFAEAQIEQAQAYTFSEKCKGCMYVAFGLSAIVVVVVQVLR